MNREIFMKAKNIDKHLEEFKEFKNELLDTALPSLYINGERLELNPEDAKALAKFLDERISNLEKRFEEL